MINGLRSNYITQIIIRNFGSPTATPGVSPPIPEECQLTHASVSVSHPWRLVDACVVPPNSPQSIQCCGAGIPCNAWFQALPDVPKLAWI